MLEEMGYGEEKGCIGTECVNIRLCILGGANFGCVETFSFKNASKFLPRNHPSKRYENGKVII